MGTKPAPTVRTIPSAKWPVDAKHAKARLDEEKPEGVENEAVEQARSSHSTAAQRSSQPSRAEPAAQSNEAHCRAEEAGRPGETVGGTQQKDFGPMARILCSFV